MKTVKVDLSKVKTSIANDEFLIYTAMTNTWGSNEKIGEEDLYLDTLSNTIIFLTDKNNLGIAASISKEFILLKDMNAALTNIISSFKKYDKKSYNIDIVFKNNILQIVKYNTKMFKALPVETIVKVTNEVLHDIVHGKKHMKTPLINKIYRRRVSDLDKLYSYNNVHISNGSIEPIELIDISPTAEKDIDELIEESPIDNVDAGIVKDYDELEEEPYEKIYVDIRKILNMSVSEFKSRFKNKKDVFKYALEYLESLLDVDIDPKYMLVYIRILKSSKKEKVNVTKAQRTRMRNVVKHYQQRYRLTYLIHEDSYSREGYTQCPHARSGHWRTYKSGKRIWINTYVVHKEEYQKEIA